MLREMRRGAGIASECVVFRAISDVLQEKKSMDRRDNFEMVMSERDHENKGL